MHRDGLLGDLTQEGVDITGRRFLTEAGAGEAESRPPGMHLLVTRCSPPTGRLAGVRMGQLQGIYALIELDSDAQALRTARHGQRIEVWADQDLCCRGLVEENVPHLGVVWISEAGIGGGR